MIISEDLNMQLLIKSNSSYFSYSAIVTVIASTTLSENIINLLRAVFISFAAEVGISDGAFAEVVVVISDNVLSIPLQHV